MDANIDLRHWSGVIPYPARGVIGLLDSPVSARSSPLHHVRFPLARLGTAHTGCTSFGSDPFLHIGTRDCHVMHASGRWSDRAGYTVASLHARLY
jgi:hypothetical protein